MSFKRSQFYSYVTFAVIIGVIGLISLYLRGQSVTNVFNDMLSNNLSTPGVTRVLLRKSSALSVAQYTQLNLGSNPIAHGITIFQQGKGSITTEEISDQKSDYVRYRKIVATTKTANGKPVNTSQVVGQWAKLDSNSNLGSTVTTGLLDQSLLGIMPIANLETAKRHELLNYIDANGVFSYDSSKVKTVTENGRKVYRYNVSVKPAVYVALMQQFGKLVGAKEYAQLNPSDYASASDLALVVSVDTASRTLARVTEVAGQHVESYQGFGVSVPTTLPKATVTTKQLEDRISALQK